MEYTRTLRQIDKNQPRPVPLPAPTKPQYQVDPEEVESKLQNRPRSPYSMDSVSALNKTAQELWNKIGYPSPEGYTGQVREEMPWWGSGAPAAARGTSWEPWADPEVNIRKSDMETLSEPGKLEYMVHENDHLHRNKLDNLWREGGPAFTKKGSPDLPSGETFMDSHAIDNEARRKRLSTKYPQDMDVMGALQQHYNASNYPTEEMEDPESLKKFAGNSYKPTHSKLFNTFAKDVRSGDHPQYTPENMNFSLLERLKQRLAGVTPIDPREAVDWHSAAKTNREDPKAFETWFKNLQDTYKKYLKSGQ